MRFLLIESMPFGGSGAGGMFVIINCVCGLYLRDDDFTQNVVSVGEKVRLEIIRYELIIL